MEYPPLLVFTICLELVVVIIIQTFTFTTIKKSRNEYGKGDWYCIYMASATLLHYVILIPLHFIYPYGGEDIIHLSFAAAALPFYWSAVSLTIFQAIYRYEKIFIIARDSRESYILKGFKLASVVLPVVCTSLYVSWIIARISLLWRAMAYCTLFTSFFIGLLDLVLTFQLSIRVISSIKKTKIASERNKAVVDALRNQYKVLKISLIVMMIVLVLVDVIAAVVFAYFNEVSLGKAVVFVHVLVTFHILTMLKNGIKMIDNSASQVSKPKQEVITELPSVYMDERF